ncbi:MAG TPA: hypothetical protein VMZ91_10160 [Candidatus Paceibacterota bacterium]|nr:hypothetical protein [Candidatus Paceibacterota bacterium]
MTYDNETRKEEMETERNEDIEKEIIEDKIREETHDFEDGSLDTYIGENTEQLIASFIDTYNEEWISFCKTNFNEANE